MAIFKIENNDEKLWVALRDSLIIFMFVFISAVLEATIIHNGYPTGEHVFIAVLLSASAFLLSLAGKLDVDLTGYRR